MKDHQRARQTEGLAHGLKQYKPVHEISNNVIYATGKALDQPDC